MKAIKLLLMCLMVCLSSSSLFAIDDGVFFTVNGLTYEQASRAAAQTSNDVKVYMGNYSGAITIPATVTYNGQTCNVVEIGSYCFENCNLTSISIGSKVRYIRDCAFSGCSISNGITIPSTVTTIAYNAFRNTKLTSLTIPSTAKFDLPEFVGFSSTTLVTLNIEVTGLTQLYSLDCSNLKNLSLSSGKLPGNTFKCPKLETLTLKHSTKLAMTSSEWPSTSYVPAPEKIILYVPSSLVNSYKSDSFWQRFGAITNVGDTTKPLILQASTTSKTLNAGENFTLSYYMAPSGSASVSYTSSNTSVATVTSAGKVTAVATGTATITMKAGSKSATCAVTVSHTHSYNVSGKCTACGNQLTFDSNGFSDLGDYYQEPTLSNVYYQIANGGNLYWFSQYVNAGNITANAKITKNITVNSNVLKADGTPNGASFRSWIPIGLNQHFKGIFIGQSFTISGLYYNNNSTVAGLFGHCSGATIDGVSIMDSYFKGNWMVGGIVANLIDNSSITYCVNNATCDSYQDSWDDVGGICGYIQSSKIEYCVNYGTISGNSKQGNYGGIIGGNGGSAKYCANYGKVIGKTSNDRAAGIVAYYGTGGIEQCFNVGEISGPYSFAICGYSSSGVTYCAADQMKSGCSSLTPSSSGNNRFFTTSEFANGNVAFYLNKNISAGSIWYQNLDNGDTQDVYPVLDSTHGKVYSGYAHGGTSASYSNSSMTVKHTTAAATSNYKHDSDYTMTATWTGYTVCSIKEVCSVCGKTITQSANITNAVTKSATCTTSGTRTYTAKVTTAGGRVYTTTKAETIAATGHSYGAPTWTWATNGKSATAKFTCSVCNDTQTKSATITSAVKTQPTCTTMGTTTYTAKVTFNNTQYSSTKNVQDIAAIDHDFSTSSECSVCHTHNTYALADGTAYTKTEQIDNVDVTYTRNFSTTNWQAFYVPFEIDYDLIKEELEVGRINAFYQYDDDEDGDPDRFSLEFFKMKDGATLRANYPYLVKAKTTGKKTFTFENVTLHKAESNFIDCATVDTRFILTGVYEIFTSTNDDTYSISNGIIGNLPQGNRINAMRWYITLEDRTGMANISKAKARTIDLVEGSYNEESETTSITAYSISSANAIYNMNGVYVGSATESTIADVIKELPCGIYIYRGHKYIINK